MDVVALHGNGTQSGRQPSGTSCTFIYKNFQHHTFGTFVTLPLQPCTPDTFALPVCTHRQQLAAMGQRWSELESQAAAANAAAEEARAAAHKAEQDLADLSGAYNSLEAHSHQLEAQLRELQQQQPQQQLPSSGNVPSVSGQQDGDVAERVAVAVAEARAEGAGKLRALEEQLDRRIQEAVEQVRHSIWHADENGRQKPV